VLENGMVVVHSIMSSSIHEMFSIFTQFQLQQQVKRKTLKNNENDEKRWKIMEEITLDPSSHLGFPNYELSFELYFLV
jgi:hypothetical protein